MKRLVLTAFAAAALVLPATAAAKGPSEATITGPGLSSTLTIAGNGEGDTSTDLGLLVTEAGFFPEVYGQSPSPLLRTKPTGLGPRYAVVYTVLLKPATPQNIVIGGASGAMPPILGWAAISDDVAPQALILFLIIFVWTPPHFWALALYRAKEYANAGLPMLPVTHGPAYTRLQIVLYTIVLFAVSLLPFAIRMSGWIYLVTAVILSGIFIGYAVALKRRYSDRLSRQTFRYSIAYLAGLFSALLFDHYWQ